MKVGRVIGWVLAAACVIAWGVWVVNGGREWAQDIGGGNSRAVANRPEPPTEGDVADLPIHLEEVEK